MNRLFDLNNHVALKFQEIQYGFISAVEALLDTDKSAEYIKWGLRKLWRLKDFYETQLTSAYDLEQVKDIKICFKCFDKDKPCTDCD